MLRISRLAAVPAVAAVGALALFAQGYRAGSWLAPGSGDPVPGFGEYGDPAGTLGTVIDGGTVESAGHPFFEALGTNGRSCVSCHQPAWGMSVSADALRDRWEATYGTDPVFAAFDGANCPDLPQASAASHSLLLDRGLFRIPLAWPPKNADGSPKAVEFGIAVVHDPTGCNRSPQYGLASANPTLSVFRRPRMAANLKYVTADGNEALNRPSTNLMTDGREASLTSQALSAIMGHEEAATAPSAETLRKIVDFESRVYAAQLHVYNSGRFDDTNSPSSLSPSALLKGASMLGKPANPVQASPFGNFGKWHNDSRDNFRASAARGADLFQYRSFSLDATAHSPASKGTCATCHASALTGQAHTAGWMDIGTTTQPHWTEPASKTDFAKSELPIFKVTCRADAAPHPFLGREIYTTDPGRALISGRCADVGSIVMQQLRGLAARAPYFANGSAETLRDVVNFYDRRYSMKLTEAEKADLANFLAAL